MQRILELLGEGAFVTVESLCRTFYVSHPTIYRDLRELERQKVIIRGNGGAVRVAEEKTNLPLQFRQSRQIREKELLARAAVKLVVPGSTIFLDASSTAACMADWLDPAMDITVLTSGLLTAIRMKNAGIRTCCLGGLVSSNSMATGGKLAYDMLAHFRIQTLFFSAYGVDHKGIIADSSEEESHLRRYLLRKNLTSVLLCDGSKFGRRSTFRIAAMNDVDYLVTDGPVPKEFPQPRQGTIFCDTE